MAEFPLELIDKKIKSDPEMLQLAKDDPIEFDSKVMQIYKEFGYKPDGSPIPMMQQAATRISKRTGLPEGLVQAGMALPIPLATTAISAAATTRRSKTRSGPVTRTTRISRSTGSATTGAAAVRPHARR